MNEKVKNEKQSNKKDWITKISTILIIIIAIISVIGAFYIYNTQSYVKKYSEMADKYYDLVDNVEKDIMGLVQIDGPKLQQLKRFYEEFLRINSQISYLKTFNGTGNLTVTQNEIEQLAIEAVTNLVNGLNIAPSIYAYLWTIDNGGIGNNYTIYGIQNYLVGDDYPYFEPSLEPEIIYYAELILISPQLLLIKEYNWYFILYQDLRIIELYGATMSQVAIRYGINLSDYTYDTFVSNATSYSQEAEFYKQSISIMSTAILLFAISALVIGFLVQINLKKLKWISLLVGILVAIIAIYTFGLALGYL